MVPEGLAAVTLLGLRQGAVSALCDFSDARDVQTRAEATSPIREKGTR
jgi:hypothetical protein